jgi:hypothetical protein
VNIVDKTRTKIVHQILSALGTPTRFDMSDESGVELVMPDTIHDVFRWHEKTGEYVVSTVITVNVTKTLIKGQAQSL